MREADVDLVGLSHRFPQGASYQSQFLIMTDPLDSQVMSIKQGKIRQLTGSCLCAGVSYRIDGPVRDVVNCYCTQCRKSSGHHVAATCVHKDHLTLITQDSLIWYECLPTIFRGFCKNCGGNLFWKRGDKSEVSIMAGTLDAPTNLKTVANIFTEDASDYCQIHEINSPED